MTQPTQVTLQDAYDEACQALGEAIVEKRLMAKAAAAQIEMLTAQVSESDAADAAAGST